MLSFLLLFCFFFFSIFDCLIDLIWSLFIILYLLDLIPITIFVVSLISITLYLASLVSIILYCLVSSSSPTVGQFQPHPKPFYHNLKVRIQPQHSLHFNSTPSDTIPLPFAGFNSSPPSTAYIHAHNIPSHHSLPVSFIKVINSIINCLQG